MKKTRVAVIGCGSISVMHLDSIHAFEDLELVAVCDIKEDRAKICAKKYGVKYYTDHITLLDEEKPDAIHICLPHYLHVPVACDAFRRGVSVLSEKPMSIRYEDAVGAVNLAKEMKVQYGVIFQCRYNTPCALVKRRILEGALGKVRCGRITLTWYRPDNYYDASDWKGTWDKEGGGVVIDQAIHSLDLANWMIDSKPLSIQSSLHNRNHANMIVEDSAEGFIQYENGASLAFFAMNNYCVDEPIEIRLCCEKGNVIFSYDKAEISYNDGRVETVLNQTDDILCQSGGKEYWGFKHSEQIRQFYNALAGKEELEISGEEALKIQQIVCKIYENNDCKIK